MRYILVLFVCIASSQLAISQSVFGKWEILKESGEVRSIIEIYENDGIVNGKVIEILDEEKEDNLCVECEGEEKNKKILGLVLLKDFKKDQEKYVDGTILNPDDGKIYKSKIWVDEDNPNILNVRGYIGFFYKTMEWRRLIE